ncbi:MerR family transcriptional regulator [Sabulicella rubraurantiaca]|uniref:MerR family transcriptional regulator n=1 Tax=Sabulicella rubraurantiaca TaxID=2811429 RepID=UPI001A96BA81|nr:MerR family transcriptional regulator [Sabulicella rubraurantiaca]
MNIKEASERSGVSAKMIRHYEMIGLLRAERRPNNYRTYTSREISVLRFIRHARDLNFPLAEVKRLLGLWQDDQKAAEEVRTVAMEQVEVLEEKAQSMRAMAKALRDLAETIASQEKPDVPRFEVA